MSAARELPWSTLLGRSLWYAALVGTTLLLADLPAGAFNYINL